MAEALEARGVKLIINQKIIKTMTNLLPFINLVKAHIEDISLHAGATIPLSNTVNVNLSLAADVPAQKIFKSYASALAWIIANGSPSISNLWQIILPPGNVGDIVLSNSFVRIVCTRHTIINSIYSNVFIDNINLANVIENATILNLYIKQRVYTFCKNCYIYNVSAAAAESGTLRLDNCIIAGGNFERITSYTYNYCMFLPQSHIINLHGNFNYCKIVYAFGVCFTTFSFFSEDLYFNHTDIIGRFLFTNTNAGPYLLRATATFKFSSISEDAPIDNNTTLNFHNSILKQITFGLVGLNYCNLYSSELETIVRAGDAGAVFCYGHSTITKHIGYIDWRDFNATPNQYIAATFTGAIPVGMYIDEIFFVVSQKFNSLYYGYSGLKISKIEQIDISDFINEIDSISNCKPNNHSQNNNDISVLATLSGANTQDWRGGQIEIYCKFKSYPILN